MFRSLFFFASGFFVCLYRRCCYNQSFLYNWIQKTDNISHRFAYNRFTVEWLEGSNDTTLIEKRLIKNKTNTTNYHSKNDWHNFRSDFQMNYTANWSCTKISAMKSQSNRIYIRHNIVFSAVCVCVFESVSQVDCQLHTNPPSNNKSNYQETAETITHWTMLKAFVY